MQWLLRFLNIKSWWWARQQQSTKAKSDGSLYTDGNDQEMSHFELRVRLGPLMRELLPGYGTCYSCGWPWPLILSHTTYYAELRGCFPLCEQCWRKLTPQQRLPHYRALWESWGDPGYASWDDIEAAVLAGK